VIDGEGSAVSEGEHVEELLTITSRASTLESRPMPTFQLKPSGAMAGSMKWPNLPMRLAASCAALSAPGY
jgi:hypothetical protein